MSRQCFLKCLANSHSPIKLPDKIETVIGRSKITKIKDLSCSRQQISIKPYCDDGLIEVKQLGVNPSGLDGFAMTKNGVYKVGHGSKIEVLLNNHIHVVEFDPPPVQNQKTNGKRKSDEDITTPREIKMIKLETVIETATTVAGKLTQCDTWEEIDRGELYVFTSKGVKASEKIAAFDMDGTLIKTKSGKVHPVDTKDWQIAFPSIAGNLKKLISNDFKIVILSNQAPIGNGRIKIEDFQKKIEAVVEKLDVPIQVYIATGKGFYRKPLVGMWKTLSEKINDGIKIDMANSFYCGDAAGRLANWAPGKKKDHSMADKLMAQNLSLKFYTPEEYFLGHSISNVPMAQPAFIPMDIKAEPFQDNLLSTEKEILVMVGFPGSGKSFLAKQIEKKSNHKYVAVCRDVLGTWQKCAAKATELLQKGKSVIVDSTNPDAESRARWTSLAKNHKVQCRCAKMAVTKSHSLHNNKYRELMKINHVPVSDIVIHSFANKFIEPTVNEGFKEIIVVKFNPIFDNEESEKIYRMHLLEK